MTRSRPFTTIAVLIFCVVALLHAYRIATHFQVTMGSHAIPEWASWVGLAIAATMAVMLFRESKR